MTAVLEADAVRGFCAGFELVPVALGRIRMRMLDVCDNLDADDWQAQSRCELWSVHDVVRHVRDACRIHVASLQGDPTPFSSGDPFDTRKTPRRWLEQTAGQTPAETVREMRECVATEELALNARVAEFADGVVGGPYGEVHWTVFTAHVFWDAWLHARDVTEVLREVNHSTPVEDEVVALYSFLIASMPALRMKHHFELTVALTGGDGTTYAASVVPGSVTLRAHEVTDEPDLHGELAPIVEALAGRGPELASVLDGEASALEPLTWLRATLRPAV